MLLVVAISGHVSLAVTTYVGQDPLIQSVPFWGKFVQPPSRPLAARSCQVEMEFASAIVSHVSPSWISTVVPVHVAVEGAAEVLMIMKL